MKQQTSLSSFFGASAATKSKPQTKSNTISKPKTAKNDKPLLNKVKPQSLASNSSLSKKEPKTTTTKPRQEQRNGHGSKEPNRRTKKRPSEEVLVDTDDEEGEEEGINIDASSKSKKNTNGIQNGGKALVNSKKKTVNGVGGRKAKKAKLVIQEDEDDDDEICDPIKDELDESEAEMEVDDDDDDQDFEGEEEDEDDEELDGEEEVEEDDIDEEEDMTLQELNSNTKLKKETTKKKNAFTLLKQPQSKDKKNKSKSKPSTDKKKNANSHKIDTKHDDNEWKEDAPSPYSTLTETLCSIEAITGRLEIQSHLTNLFSQCIRKKPQDLITLVYLSSNSVAPAYECVELGIGDAILIKAVAEANGSTSNMIKQKYESDGDLGTVAMKAKGKQRTLGFGRKPKPLMANEVLQVYRKIAAISGSQSQKIKVDMIKGLLVRATQKGNESKYIIRGLQGKLRIGLAQSTVLISLAHAVLLSCPINQNNTEKEHDSDDDDDGEDDTSKTQETDKKDESELSLDCRNVKNTKLPMETRLESAVNIVKKAYSEVSSYDTLVDALTTTPIWELHKSCTLRPGNPVTPMLAKPTKSIQEVLKRLSGKRFTCEYKYDGERAQVHMQDDGVTKVFSRSLLDTSEKFPEVPLYVKEACVNNVKSFILDTEVVAYNRETKQFVPFQVLSTRKKTEESEDNAKVKVIVQAFDLMYLNGKSLLDHTLSERRELLLKNFQVVDGKFQFATSLDHKEDGDTTLIEDFLDAAVKGQCEGLMVKTLDENASYQPSYRSLNWLKLKKDYLEGMGDSVDLVPIGAYHGKGKRTGVYGAYLLACYDEDTEEFQSVCKIGTGFSDEDLKTLSDGLKDKIITEKSSQYNVSSNLECDVWFEACQVWEVKAADLSKSSTHKGAIDKTGETGRGIGLRFPRFERLRDDKKPENATTSDQILEMYYAQDSIVNSGVTDDFGDDGI